MNGLLAHRRRLLLRKRCPECAERAAAGAILRGEPCSHCHAELVLDHGGEHADRMLGAVRRRWGRWRFVVYPLALIANLLAGLIPLLSTVVLIVTMLIADVALVRRPILWLSPARRVMTRTTVKLWFAMLGVVSALVNLAAAPFITAFGAGAIASAVSGLLATALYIEGALWLVTRRVRLESVTRRLGLLEWTVPVGLLGGLVLSGLGTVVVGWAVLWLLTSAEIPGVSEIAGWLLEAPG